MRKFRKIAVFFMLLFFGVLSYSQTKNEKEERIKKKMFPKKALDLLDALPKDAKRIKFYKETNDTIISYEAKLKLNKRGYSIEFDKNGTLEDIEITINLTNLPNVTKASILHYLETNYDRFDIIKIQKQFKNETSAIPSDVLSDALLNQKEKGVFYELIVDTHRSDDTVPKEFTFNESGNYVSEKNIILSSSYYVLY